MTGYVFKFHQSGQARTFSPEGKVADMTDEQIKLHNARLELAELEAWCAKPDHFVAYVSDKSIVSTWLGTTLGTIVRRTKYRTNLSRSMIALTVQGTNGATYHGRYGADWTQAVRLRKCK